MDRITDEGFDVSIAQTAKELVSRFVGASVIWSIFAFIGFFPAQANTVLGYIVIAVSLFIAFLG